MNFGNNLKDLRETWNITQGQLAEYLQVSRPTIAGYETKSRQPDFEKLEKIANYFHVSIDYLISGSEAANIDIHLKKEPNEKSLDRDVIMAYRKLSLESKQDVLKYIELLQLRDDAQNVEWGCRLMPIFRL